MTYQIDVVWNKYIVVLVRTYHTALGTSVDIVDLLFFLNAYDPPALLKYTNCPLVVEKEV